MEILYLKHESIDKAKWDENIQRSVNANIYALSWYLDIVSPGWNALVTQDFSVLFPLTHKKKLGIPYLYQPYFAQQLGLFFQHEPNNELLQAFFNRISEKYKYIDITLNSACPIININGYNIINKINHELSLNQPFSSLFSNFSENTRRNIAKAKKKQIQIMRNSSTVENIIQLFKRNKGTLLKNTTDDIYNLLRTITSVCLNKGLLETWSAYTNYNELCAGAIFLKSFNRYIYLFSAVDENARQNGAMHLLLSNFIEFHSPENAVLDFEGSSIPGLARFYKSFGAKEIIYQHVQKNELPAFIRWLKK